MTGSARMDDRGRVVLHRDLRRAAGITHDQKFKVTASRGRIVLEVATNSGKVVQRGNLKVWSGDVPLMPIEEAIERLRHG